MSDEWEYTDDRKHYGYERWELHGFGPHGHSLVIDRMIHRRDSNCGRKWEWWSYNTSWQTFPPSCRTLEQRKAYAMMMARMS